MNCDRPDISEKLVPYVEGALGEPDRTEVAGHLRRCLPCQDDARQVKESILTLKAAVRTGVWKEPREHTSSEWLAMHFEDERAREAGFLPSSGLTDEQARQVRVHLAECQECREELVMLRELAAEAVGEAAQGHQSLPRALRLEIERLYPVQRQTERPVSERTLGLADRLMAWVNPKSLVMASLCIVALTFSYSLTRGTDSPDLAKNPTTSSSEIALLDRESDQSAQRSLESAQSQKKEKGESLRQKTSADKIKTGPDNSPPVRDDKPARDEKLAGVGARPGERGATESTRTESARPRSTQPVRTASTAAAPRPAPTVAATSRLTAAKPVQKLVAVRPAAQNPTPSPVAAAVKPAAEPATESVGDPPLTPSPMMALHEQEADNASGGMAKDEGKIQGEPVLVAAGPPTGPVPNAMSEGREEGQMATQSEVVKQAALPPAAGAPATGGRISVPAASTANAPAATRTSSVPASRRVTGVVKPPAPAAVPMRSLPDDKAAGYSAAASAPGQSTKTPADIARKQSMSRTVDGLVSDQVALSRQATLGPKARSVARQISANASVLVEERADGSVTVTVRPDRPLNAEEKDKLRRLLRSELNLGEADTISIRQ